MSRNIEIEFKNIVTEAEFQLLLKAFHISKEMFFSQTNHYFDTKDFALKKLNAALRIRSLPEKYEITLKKPLEDGLLEINDYITEAEAKAFINDALLPNGEVKDEIQKMNIPIDKFILFGTLRTDRSEVEYEKGLLVFDHSFYLGKEDFEIEYETQNREKGEKIFYHLLKKFNIEIRNADNKISRLYHAL
ncbi:CYTH domain-containing protein [Lederbergia citri]|uniref:CYTH domain-containing protein n=1 Tax=Lederbergia citri TaxID=2833580 RepID=A0A942TC90_9BACI|nr:CYTH domain-containing protein [Lederbergia citri]MBS4193657.1 CYTH domain-containing protein [Lederbergia citri]